MNPKLKFEIKRKFIHLFALAYIGIYLYFQTNFNHSTGLIALTSILAFFLILEYYRILKKKKIPIIHIFWRGSEKNKLGGHVYFVLGAIIAFSVFDIQIAITALLMTIFGDMAAAIIGISFGKHWIQGLKDRAWEGVIAQFIVNIIIAYLILNNVIVSIAMALAATIVETLFSQVDDNLSIPLFSGLTAQILGILIN
jgi:dolichol kinase|tara:strand:- start:1664 stop:2254 length:591 start_codon:yes stop_codon:yes gene_type:complete